MRVAMVTESFLPQINGVTMSVAKVCEQLRESGHPVLVVAPGTGPTRWAGADVVRVPSMPVPGYGTHRVAWPWPWLAGTLRGFRPDLVHLASPTVLGAQAATVAERLGVPSIAVYQTDLAAYAARYYHLPVASRAVWSWLARVHRQAALTLAPSTAAAADLTAHGVPRVRVWPRGVDLERFHPRHRDEALRTRLSPEGRLLVGYVGRLAAEKQVELLEVVHRRPDVQLVVVGDGPTRPVLERLLPRARFLGLHQGEALSALVASLDVFVHTGPHETFCQAAQEALASGVPVVAPAAGGLLDLVTDGVNGRLFTPGSAAALSRAAESLVRDGAARRACAERARPSVAGRSWRAVTQDYLAHCDRVLRPAAPAMPA